MIGSTIEHFPVIFRKNFFFKEGLQRYTLKLH